MENYIEIVTKNLPVIMQSEKLNEILKNGALELASTVFGVPVILGKIVKDVVVGISDILFWDKMTRFLKRALLDYDSQTKLASRFNNNNNAYKKYAKRLIHIINSVNDDQKIEYIADLTRCLLLCQLDFNLYYKLINFISVCTPEELEYIRKYDYNARSSLNLGISILYQYGLFAQVVDDGGIAKYTLSSFGKALKQNSLNFNDGLNEQERYTSYDQMEALSIPEPISNSEIDRILSS